MGAVITSKLYVKGEEMLIEANETISLIHNDTVRTQIQSTLAQGTANTQSNIELYTAMFQYGWIIAAIITALVLFLYTRIRVEYGGSGLL
jgi:hypothetical protein